MGPRNRSINAVGGFIYWQTLERLEIISIGDHKYDLINLTYEQPRLTLRMMLETIYSIRYGAELQCSLFQLVNAFLRMLIFESWAHTGALSSNNQ